MPELHLTLLVLCYYCHLCVFYVHFKSHIIIVVLPLYTHLGLPTHPLVICTLSVVLHSFLHL